MLDYISISQKFKPNLIKTLLIGEAPPPNGKTYFYIPQKMSINTQIEKYPSLPATIFYHFYQEIPKTIERYKLLLNQLKDNGIFLMDICDMPLKVTDRKLSGSINKDNLNLLIKEIPNLNAKIIERIGKINEKDIIFLLPRLHYHIELLQRFPFAQYYSWINFRLNRQKKYVRIKINGCRDIVFKTNPT